MNLLREKITNDFYDNHNAEQLKINPLFERMQTYGYYDHKNVLTSHLILGIVTVAYFIRLIVLYAVLLPLNEKYPSNDKILKFYNREFKNLHFETILKITI